MIVTLTINPAIDRTISVDRLAFEDRAYVNSNRESAGGRGINASCVIHSFGGESTAVFPSGGHSGKRLEAFLNGCGLRIAVVPIRNPIRTNLTVTDKHGLTVNLNETGPTLSKAEVARVEQTVLGALDKASWLMVCGSIPPGVPSSFYARLISTAKRKGVKTLLDADGAALREGIEAGPTVVSPNQQEAERLLGVTLLTRKTYVEAAETIRAMGPESVVLSVGSRGAIGAFPKGLFEARSAARGRGLPHRLRGRAGGGLHMVHGAQSRPSGRGAALGRGGGDGLGADARDGVRQPAADRGNLPPGGSQARRIA